ncbi:MAG: tyrosine--tRNA ligase [Deltaproteobacteria bacterium RIFCSPHIGHO2_02_FULL_40_11]|nr:MAG: tyrosine--tRNA ligase [Deltaproteobacteria bacterium RIFCSPHIGHO2_02_FULL_40_11]
MRTPKEQLQEVLRGTVDLVSEAELFNKLSKKKKLRVKLGVDPSSKDIHLGHTVVLQKLRQFQDLGHQAVLIIGDYTALVGDPSGKQATRPQLTLAEVTDNAKTYFNQVQKILKMDAAEIRYNGEWFTKLAFVDVIKLASKMTVARMLERDDFSKRFKSGQSIAIHEFLYPLMQGYDSVMVKSDVELGGTDQLFNLLVGRQLQKDAGQDPQVILTTPLLEGTDGIQKMSKSLNNAIGITESPKEMFGKIMSVSDEMMWKYTELLSKISAKDLEEKQAQAADGKLNPKDAKVDLALEIVERFHGKKEAQIAKTQFEALFQKKALPDEMEEEKVSSKALPISLMKLLVDLRLVASNGEAKRMMKQGGVSLNQKKIEDLSFEIKSKGEYILKVGKRKFKKVIFS